MTYTIVNLVMLSIIAVSYVIRRPKVSYKTVLLTLILLTIMTIIFDNLIIAANIVAYHQAHLLGIYIGHMPLEDLSYTIAACLLVPLLWGKEHDRVE